MLLQVVALTGDVGGDLGAVAETLRIAEFGFLGVVVYTRVQTPACCGFAFRAGALVLVTLGERPLRTNC